METPKELLETLKLAYNQTEEVKGRDQSKFRYVIYARKSTESEERQVRSLQDQIIECKQMAERSNFRILDIVKESESAKEPDIRPKFRMLMEAMKKGKYDGIIAWHPDRLARNMKDAGEIIDALDKRVVKDLQFVSFTFQNNTMGKMLLGIAFVLSKQYSDQLSDNVKRGIRRSLEEGRYLNKAKQGYVKDRNQILHPDGENFTLIKTAFKMRLQEKTLDEIAEFLNKSAYTRATAEGAPRKSCKMDKKKVSNFLRDPFYAGVLVYGENMQDLTEIIPSFVPMITVEEFEKINGEISKLQRRLKLAKAFHPTQGIKANLMRQMVICGECSQSMVAGITPKKGKDTLIEYFYYRCDTRGCPRKGKSIRARLIVGFVKDFLRKNQFTSKPIYDHYVREMHREIKRKEVDYSNQINAFKLKKRGLEEKFEQTKHFIVNETDTQIQAYFKGDMKVLERQIIDIEAQIKQTIAEKEKNSTALLTYSEHLELFEKLAERIEKTTDMDELDFIIKKFFLNFTIRDEKVANYTINSPFREYIEKGFVRFSRGSGT